MWSLPNKVKTISQFLKDDPNIDYVIMASVGHITEIKNSGLYNMGIDPNNNFEADYVVSDDKKEVVKKLKEQVKLADKVILASDPDREGEAISHHLKSVLKIPNSKYERITYHEITKKAITEALKNPRKIDDDLVSAAQSRQKLDKIVGYRLSPIARRSIECKSVGRCQSAGLKILVEREEEILNFKPETYYDLYLNFKKNTTEFKAKYIGTDKDRVEHLSKKEYCDEIIRQCKGNDFIIKNIESKDSFENPKLPFTTNTFQQEVSKTLNLTIKQAMNCAQQLFEGINLNGQHVALITYIRTDSAEYAPEFLPILENKIKSLYGNSYYEGVRKSKKSENVQDGHEAIRPVDLEMTPEKVAQYINNDLLLKVYRIIYNRTLASAMKSAIIGVTDYSIYNTCNKFILTSKELKFDGYRRVYNDYLEKDDNNVIVTEKFAIGEILSGTSLDYEEKSTKPKARYTESTFVSKLEKTNIGRPSTYATIIGTLLDASRGYCKLENKEIVPTSKGIQLSHFLDQSFPDIINLTYTSEMEKDLDLIANGKLNDVDFLTQFYSKLEESIKKMPSVNQIISADQRICPECGNVLVLKWSPKTKRKFYGCSNYPICRHLENI